METKTKRLLGFIGGLAVAAIGGGLWNIIFAPVWSIISRILMSLLTLGISSLRDSVYAEASLGFHEVASCLGLAAFDGLFTGIFLSLVVLGLSRRGKVPFLAGKDGKLPSYTQYSLVVIVVFCLMYMFTVLLFTAYTDNVIAEFNRSLAVVTPYVTQHQREVFISRFASVRTRNDFVGLYDELNVIAKTHGQRVSRFSPW